MILWNETEKKYGINASTATNKDKVIIKCTNCGSIKEQKFKNYKQMRKTKPNYICRSCVNASKQYRRTQQIATKNAWACGKHKYKSKPKRKPHSQATKDKIGRQSKRLWRDKKFRQSIIDAQVKLWQDEDYKSKMKTVHEAQKDKLSKLSKKLWESKSHRDKYYKAVKQPEWIEKQRKSHSTEDYLVKQAERLCNIPKVSNIQEILYSLLDDLNVKYYREYNDKPDDPECRIGPYSFDCVIPNSNGHSLLIECNGDYWHNSTKAKYRDIQKATYIRNYFPQYKLKVLWEHEFFNKDRIHNLLKYWLKLSDTPQLDFELASVKIKRAPASDYVPLLSKYHYLHTAGRGGIAYGGYIGGTLIAIAVFSPLIRQNITIGTYAQQEVRELSRLCIHPSYQRKNFGSWFISKCIKKLPKQYKCIIAYADTTFNHDGTVYKGCNFKIDKIVPADYWYVSKDKWVMHKKTLYGRARKMKIKESEFAKTYGYKKVYGQPKIRLIYERQ